MEFEAAQDEPGPRNPQAKLGSRGGAGSTGSAVQLVQHTFLTEMTRAYMTTSEAAAATPSSQNGILPETLNHPPVHAASGRQAASNRKIKLRAKKARASVQSIRQQYEQVDQIYLCTLNMLVELLL